MMTGAANVSFDGRFSGSVTHRFPLTIWKARLRPTRAETKRGGVFGIQSIADLRTDAAKVRKVRNAVIHLVKFCYQHQSRFREAAAQRPNASAMSGKGRLFLSWLEV